MQLLNQRAPTRVTTWLVGLACTAAVAAIAATNSAANPAAPKPAAADRRQLPAGFTKQAPASIADLKAMERHAKALIARVSPAVVAVEVSGGSGSGVVISTNGLVLTAGHVAGRAGREVRFTFSNGSTARGVTLGARAGSDAGLMRITDPGAWPRADVGDLQQASVGDWVLAMGHPGGFDRQRSLVVRLGRIIQLSPDTLQTDCTISPGDSGGPVFDMHGRVVGIHSFISTSATDNFHVPINQFLDAWTQLVQGNSGGSSNPPPRAFVGVTLVDDTAGCRLDAIESNSPAAKAGLKTGDLVLRVNGREIKAAAVFRRWIAETEPGETIEVEIKRGDKTLSLPVKMERPPRGK